MLPRRTRVALAATRSWPEPSGLRAVRALCVSEQQLAQLHTVLREAIRRLRTDAGRSESAHNLAFRRNALPFEDEDVLHRNDVAFHARDLGDRHDLTCTVRETA